MAREFVFARVDENGADETNEGEANLPFGSSSGRMNGLLRGDRGGAGERVDDVAVAAAGTDD